jgi:homoserine kinase type II
MAIYTKISSKDILLIEKNYNLGKIVSFKGIKKGIENTNYLLKTKDKKFILTLFERRVHKKDLPFFMNLMDKLSKYKINCPKPQKNKRGSFLIKIKNKTASIVSFVEGKDKLKLNPKNCYEIGKNIAKFHRASKKIKLYRKNSLSLKDWPKLLNKIGNKSKIISTNLNSLMKNSFLQIKNKWPKNLPFGIIHADLFIDNIFFKKNKFHGYIDFYFACNDFLMYEIAICINALCFDKKNNKFVFNKKKSKNLIKGYSKIRRLSDKEKKSLNVLCKGAALRYLLTRTYDYLNTPKSAVIKIKNPREYIQKLKVHNQFNNFKNYYN